MNWRVVTDVPWPTLERPTKDEIKATKDMLEADLNAIHAIESEDPALLEEARRLTDQAEATRASIETRGGIYLATIGTLIPVVVFVADSVTSGTDTTLQNTAIIVLSIVASLYLFNGGRWALKSLGVGNYHRFGVSDFKPTFAEDKPGRALAQQLLKALRHNRSLINARVSAIKMAQMYIWRAVVVLICLLLVALIPNSVTRLFWPPQQNLIAVCRSDSDYGRADEGLLDFCRLESANP